MPYQFSPVNQAYLKRSLDKVSRSFTLVIQQIEPPLNDYLGTAYLICRVVDNIEDTYQPFPWKQARFAEFSQLLNRPEAATAILTHWQQETWPGLTQDEQQMMGMEAGHQLWQIYASLPRPVREIIAHWTEIMAEGMERVVDPQATTFFTTRHNIRLPIEKVDYNQYCYYVAGTVGRMATELMIPHYGLNGTASNLLLSTSEICGRALQKTNIIKDFPKDLNRGFSYLPASWQAEIDYAALRLQDAPQSWKWRAISDVLEELDNSADYLINLPYSAVGYRRASLMAMFPAYQTLLLAAQKHETLFTPQHQVKISRVTMANCLRDARRLAHNNQAILDYGRDIRRQVQSAFAEPEPLLNH